MWRFLGTILDHFFFSFGFFEQVDEQFTASKEKSLGPLSLAVFLKHAVGKWLQTLTTA